MASAAEIRISLLIEVAVVHGPRKKEVNWRYLETQVSGIKSSWGRYCASRDEPITWG